MSSTRLAEAVEKLKGGLERLVLQEAERHVADGLPPGDFRLNVTDAALRRGAVAYMADWSDNPSAPPDAAAEMFALVYAYGEQAAHYRAKMALTDPRSKGRELAVLDALTRGLDVEAAIIAANLKPPAPLEQSDGNVVQFRR